MSCIGNNWLVPGADPCVPTKSVTSLNALTDDVTLSATNNSIAVTKVGQDIQIQALQTQAFGNNTLTTSAITNAAVPLSTVGFTNAFTTDIVCNGSATFRTTSNTQYDINCYLTIDGVKMNTTDFITTINGIGHYRTITITGFRTGLTAAAHTLRMWASTTAPNGTITCSAQTTNGIANII